MSDGEIFYLVFTLIYLGECVVWVGRRGVPFVTHFVRRPRPQRASSNIGTARTGAVMLNPFPPLGTVYLAELWPVSLTADGFSTQMHDTPNPGAQPARPRRRFRWCEVELVGVQAGFVFVNGEKLIDVCSAQRAIEIAALLRRLRDCPAPEQRASIIDRALDRALSVRQVEKRHRWLLARTWWTRIDCIILFCLAFGMLPYAYWRFESAPPFWCALGIMWLLMLKISFGFFFLHRRLYPALGAERWQHFVFSVFVPQFTMRVLDALSKPWLSTHHPLAIAHAVSTAQQIDRFQHKLLRDLIHPLPLADPSDAMAVDFFQVHLRPAVQRFCRRQGIEWQKADDPPVAESVEPGCVRYCPRCFTQYDASAEACIDCRGIATRPIG